MLATIALYAVSIVFTSAVIWCVSEVNRSKRRLDGIERAQQRWDEAFASREASELSVKKKDFMRIICGIARKNEVSPDRVLDEIFGEFVVKRSCDNGCLKKGYDAEGDEGTSD